MRTLLVLCAVLCASYALKCYKDASKAEGHTDTRKEVECVCGDYCVKYFAEGKGKEIVRDKQVKHENGEGLNEEEKKNENEKVKEKTVVENTKTEKTTKARAASWDCGCSRTGGFQSDMCKIQEEGRGVFGENPQLEVTCCKGDLCNGAVSKFSLFASLISLCVFYFWKH